MAKRPLAVSLDTRITLRKVMKQPAEPVSINRTAVREAMMNAHQVEPDAVRCNADVPGIGICPQPVVKIRVNGGRGTVCSCVHCYWRSKGNCWACGALAPLDWAADALCVPCRITYSTPAKGAPGPYTGEQLQRYFERSGDAPLKKRQSMLKNRRGL